MSAAASSLRLAARRCQSGLTSKQSPLLRSFTTSSSRLEESTPTDPKEPAPAASLNPEDAQWARFEKTIESIRHGKLESATASIVNRHMTEAQRRKRPATVAQQKQKQGLLNMNEKDFIEDPEFEEDDVTAMAHGDLQQHREFREYARLMAWEMPLLTKMAKPFVPPNQSQVLRFRYTTYMGEEHPAEKKVVVEFCPDDIPGLEPVQKDKLKKLVGVRFNPETQIVKMSSEMFESQAQNKRYLGDLVDSLVREAKDPKDTFEDVPLDTRHHTFKTKPKFPREWRITPERQSQLEAGRAEALKLDQARMESGLLVDGGAFVREAHAQAAKLAGAAKLAEPAMVAGRGKAPKKVQDRHAAARRIAQLEAREAKKLTICLQSYTN
ncbi:hypothetical protein O988_02728 [Pseudogymnoascus sp. VKM F-3808]|nr:hypothetical protein O988_02728 [Pseudogymnoascus sp. VKM F-3808]